MSVQIQLFSQDIEELYILEELENSASNNVSEPDNATKEFCMKGCFCSDTVFDLTK